MEVIAFTVRSLKEKQVSHRMEFKTSSVQLQLHLPSQLQLKTRKGLTTKMMRHLMKKTLLKNLRLNFNQDNDSNFICYYDEPDSRKRGPSDIIKVTAGLTDSSKGIET